jgi:hypothetical protein
MVSKNAHNVNKQCSNASPHHKGGRCIKKTKKLDRCTRRSCTIAASLISLSAHCASGSRQALLSTIEYICCVVPRSSATRVNLCKKCHGRLGITGHLTCRSCANTVGVHGTASCCCTAICRPPSGTYSLLPSINRYACSPSFCHIYHVEIVRVWPVGIVVAVFPVSACFVQFGDILGSHS